MAADGEIHNTIKSKLSILQEHMETQKEEIMQRTKKGFELYVCIITLLTLITLGTLYFRKTNLYVPTIILLLAGSVISFLTIFQIDLADAPRKAGPILFNVYLLIWFLYAFDMIKGSWIFYAFPSAVGIDFLIKGILEYRAMNKQ